MPAEFSQGVVFQMVQKCVKAPGRPRGFDVEQALDQAMHCFWKQGYAATSLDDLQAAMNISRPSLYNAFGDKRGLFLRCLEHYSQKIAAKCLEKLQAYDTIEEALTNFLQKSVQNSCPEQNGCFVGCIASSVDDPEVRDFMAVSASGAQRAVATTMQLAIEKGQLPPDFPVETRARRAFDQMIALGFRARSGAPLEELLADARDAAHLLLAPS